MTEAEWMDCTEPGKMLKFLTGKIGDRKLRLFACACCRDIWELIPSEASRKSLEASEEYAEGRIRRKDLIEMRERARRDDSDFAQWAVMAASRPKIAGAWVAQLAADAKNRPGIHRSFAPTSQRSQQQQCRHLRDIFGSLPFRPIFIDPNWLVWNDGIVRKLAQTIYEERCFSDLPILADALEEGGCTDAALLGHLRGSGRHVRGCWALDAILGKA